MTVEKHKKIGVGLSGGADSSAAALLLLEGGHEVTGFTMVFHDSGARCAEQAAVVASRLGIRQIVVDLRKEFEQLILDRFVEDYAKGLTPSPCVVCNAVFKFGAMWRAMAAHGCEAMATGHYARVEPCAEGYALRRGADLRKDQSYFLAQLTQEQLSRAVFPLASCEKTVIQEKVRELGLVPKTEKESQDLCFLPDGDYGAMVGARRPELCREGVIVDTSGRVLGRHQGAFRYTVGQRRGLGLGGGPWFVLKTDTAANVVTIGHADERGCQALPLHDMNWLKPEPPCGSVLETTVQVRYLMRPRQARLRTEEGGRAWLEFLEPVDAAPPGQLAVAYDGDRVVCSGWIGRPEEVTK